jgi:hypothetical protein
MIDINKKYRTRDGREVRIYAVDGNMPLCVHGAFKDHGEWRSCSWQQDGVQFFVKGPFDLIEVKPRIQRTVWVNVYSNGFAGWGDRKTADANSSFTRLACVTVEIDCEEGEGL